MEKGKKKEKGKFVYEWKATNDRNVKKMGKRIGTQKRGTNDEN